MAPCGRCRDKGNMGCRGPYCAKCGKYDGNLYACFLTCESCNFNEELNKYSKFILKIYEVLSEENMDESWPNSVDKIRDITDICSYIESNFTNLVKDTKIYRKRIEQKDIRQKEFERENCNQQ